MKEQELQTDLIDVAQFYYAEAQLNNSHSSSDEEEAEVATERQSIRKQLGFTDDDDY